MRGLASHSIGPPVGLFLGLLLTLLLVLPPFLPPAVSFPSDGLEVVEQIIGPGQVPTLVMDVSYDDLLVRPSGSYVVHMTRRITNVQTGRVYVLSDLLIDLHGGHQRWQAVLQQPPTTLPPGTYFASGLAWPDGVTYRPQPSAWYTQTWEVST